MNTLADLEELILRCRSTSSRTYITEAVSCCRGGAYRSAIVATWIAVLFDFIDKLKELEMSGDANAKQKLAEFEKGRQASDWKASLKFESEVLALAQNEFELLSPVEALDLQRLLEDRNRCAHPSMASPEEPYTASAELARTHIRNAVLYLLSHPPVQGKAALDRLVKEVESEYFPTDSSKATEYFKTGPLARAREALVRNFALILLKKLLELPSNSVTRLRRFAALNAVLRMYVEEGERTLASRLPDLISAVPDDKWYRVLFLLGNVPSSWDILGDAAQSKARVYVEKAPGEDLFRFLPYAMKVPALRSLTISRLPGASIDTLARLAVDKPAPEFVGEAITRFENASSFRNAEKIFQALLLPIGEALKEAQVERVCKAFAANSQIAYAARIPNLFLQLLDEQPFLPISTEAALVIYEKLNAERQSIPEGEALRERLRSRFNF